MAINDKFLTYKSMKVSLKRAITSEFYYEAIFIEYAILEDRLESLLRHAGLSEFDKNGRTFSFAKKIDKISSNVKFEAKFVRQKFTQVFLNDLKSWAGKRNQLVHALAKIPYNNEQVKEIAIEGNELVKLLDNKVKSANNYFDKKSM